MAVTGTYGIESSRLRVDMSEKIAELEPDKSPLITLTKKMKKTRVVENPEYDWLEQELGARWDAVNAVAGYDADDTDIVVDHDEYFRIGDIVKIPRTGETLLVTNITAGTNTLTVTRSWGATAGAAIVDDDPLLIIGNINAEGATLRDIKQKEPVKKTNYTRYGCLAA